MKILLSWTAPSGQSSNVKHVRSFLVCALASAALLLGVSDFASAKQQKHMNVLELFTSQGCSSCPPADALLKTLSTQDNIIALTLPVNYWDHLGWKDTLAKDAFTKRQYAYANARGDREIYTPQMVVNGIEHVVGSRPDAIDSAIEKTDRLLGPFSVAMSLDHEAGRIKLVAGAAPEGSSYRSGKIWVACYTKSVDVSIKDGENTGRKIAYTNVVRALIPAGNWSGEATKLTVDMPSSTEFDGVAVFLQADDSHAIIGAVQISVLPK
ncbi:MAG: DUF1223 domain-containing protein [Rhodomicrobiaceae bacterium]